MPFNRDHDPRLIAFARQMRREPSEAERRMWWILRKKKLGGYRFRRQAPLLGYIADFVCLSAKLIVEVDGSQHGEELQRQYDSIRTKVFERAGFRVVRFWANVVLSDSDAVAATVYRELHHPNWEAETFRVTGRPPPQPSPGVPGEGANAGRS